jgi:hypothetical protein
LDNFRREAVPFVADFLHPPGYLIASWATSQNRRDNAVTDDLRSYAAAANDLGLSKRHERGRWHNTSREFASTDPTTRTQDARVQVSGISPKISLNSRSDLQHF